MEKLPSVMLRLPPELHDALKKRAEQEERPMSHVARRALRAYLAPESAEVGS